MSAAVRKKSGGRWLLFWLAFFIGVTLLFMANIERIKGSLRETKLLEKLFNRQGDEPEEDDAAVLERRIMDLANAAEEETVSEQSPAQNSPAKPPAQLGNKEDLEGLAQLGVTAPKTVTPQQNGQGTGPQNGAAPQTGNSAVPNDSKPGQESGKMVERMVYLMKLDTTGAILWTKVKRVLPASDKPLFDTLEALLKGPSAAEEGQGLISLIPKNVKIQNAVVRGNTAYISFSEDFLFNTYGVEGYAGQRRQIVLTATEFSNVKDVQILIDGKSVEFLGEGIWIGSPVSRNML